MLESEYHLLIAMDSARRDGILLHCLTVDGEAIDVFWGTDDGIDYRWYGTESNQEDRPNYVDTRRFEVDENGLFPFPAERLLGYWDRPRKPDEVPIPLQRSTDDAPARSRPLPQSPGTVHEDGGILLTPNQIQSWAGSGLTSGQLQRLADAIPESTVPATISEIAGNLFGREPRTVAVRINEAALEQLDGKVRKALNLPDVVTEWGTGWLTDSEGFGTTPWRDIAAAMLTAARRLENLLVVETGALAGRPRVTLAYDNIADACEEPDGITVHLEILDSGAHLCRRRYFAFDDLQFITSDGEIASAENTVANLLRGIVRDLEIELNHTFESFGLVGLQ